MLLTLTDLTKGKCQPSLCANKSETPIPLQISVGRVGESLWKILT